MGEKTVLIAIFLIGLAIFAFAAYSLISTSYYNGAGYKQALSAELSDKCATPSGYTDAQWREHMGHHPDRYAECLK